MKTLDKQGGGVENNSIHNKEKKALEQYINETTEALFSSEIAKIKEKTKIQTSEVINNTEADPYVNRLAAMFGKTNEFKKKKAANDDRYHENLETFTVSAVLEDLENFEEFELLSANAA